MSGTPILAGMATFPARIEVAKIAIASIVPQVDTLFVYLNGFALGQGEAVFGGLGATLVEGQRDIADSGKFWVAEQAPQGGAFILAMDDDLEYPADYVQRMLYEVETRGRLAVVTLHGKRYDNAPNAESYRDFTSSWRCLDEVDEAHACHVPGTGVLAYHSSAVQVGLGDFPVPKMADVWFGLEANRAGVPCVVVPHRKGWLRYLLGPADPTIWLESAGRDSVQTEAVNGAEWNF